ncbi:MAG: hypothetical protein CMM99_02440 [Rickettsiales bacterium]|nr:hypothetical protein [Rickettsiales bacterium]
MYSIIKEKKKFYILKNNKKLKTPNKKNLYAKNYSHAKSIVNEIEVKKKDEFSIFNLTSFSCNLTKSENVNIINNISKMLDYDNTLYRVSTTISLNEEMDKKLNYYIVEFSSKFKINFCFLNNIISKQEKLNIKKFIKYLHDLDNFKITILYKLSGITKSVILSYFFLNNRILPKKLFELSNIESIYQQKYWGLVDEQKKINDNYLESIKNISNFFKNIS